MITTSRRQESPIPRLRHKEPCLHEWKNFKETIKIDNPSFNHAWHPYFVVRACLNCHEKHVLDYKCE